MNLWRKFEFRGRDLNRNPFVDFGFVEVKEQRLALTSHMLRRAALGGQRSRTSYQPSNATMKHKDSRTYDTKSSGRKEALSTSPLMRVGRDV